MSQNETVVSSCDLNYFKHLFLSSLYTYYETRAAGQSVAYSSEKPAPESGLQTMCRCQRQDEADVVEQMQPVLKGTAVLSHIFL